MNKEYYLLPSNKLRFKHLIIYLVVCLCLFSGFLINDAKTQIAQEITDILAIISSALLIVLILYYYIYRVRFFSLTLLFSFVFSLIIGLPSIYLFYFKNTDNDFGIICIWAMLINVALYLLSTKTFYKKEERRLSNLFYAIFFIAAFCQIYKVMIYFLFILNSGAGHLAIYTESEELLSQVPFVIRAISGFTVTMALAVFYFKSPSIIKFIAFILLASDLIIGIRNKFFFSMICIFILYLYSNEIRVKYIFKKISKPTVLLVGFILFSLVSYFREGYQINFVNYIGIVLDSLSSTLGGMQNLFSGQIGSWDKLSPEVVFTQILPLSGLGFINNHQIAKDFSIIVLGDVSSGIALSSSGLLESTILSLHFGSVFYLIYLIGFISLITRALNSQKVLINFIAISMISGFFYAVRGELILPLAFLLKSLPIVIISPLLVKGHFRALSVESK